MEKILMRIKKMMALANDRAASEGERENAIRMAHELLAKHNLSMAEADAISLQPEEQRIKGEMDGFIHPWMRTVANAIAGLFFCKYFYNRSREGKIKHYFIGKQSNVYTAQEMSKYVNRSIDKEGRQRSKNEVFGAGTYWRSFGKGAAAIIVERCHEIRREAETKSVQPSTSTALVLASVYEKEKEQNYKFLEKEGIHLRRGSSTRSPSADAYGAGREYGATVNLNRQIGGSGKSTLRLS